MKKLFILALFLTFEALASGPHYVEDLGDDAAAVEQAEKEQALQKELILFLSGDPLAFTEQNERTKIRLTYEDQKVVASPIDGTTTAEELAQVSAGVARASLYADYFSDLGHPLVSAAIEANFTAMLDAWESAFYDLPTSAAKISLELGKLNRLLKELNRAVSNVQPGHFQAKKCVRMLKQIMDLVTSTAILLDTPLHQYLSQGQTYFHLSEAQQTVRLLGNILGNVYGKMVMGPEVLGLSEQLLDLNEFRLYFFGQNNLRIPAPELVEAFQDTLIMRIYPQLSQRETDLRKGKRSPQLLQEIRQELLEYNDPWTRVLNEEKSHRPGLAAGADLAARIRVRFLRASR